MHSQIENNSPGTLPANILRILMRPHKHCRVLALPQILLQRNRLSIVEHQDSLQIILRRIVRVLRLGIFIEPRVLRSIQLGDQRIRNRVPGVNFGAEQKRGGQLRLVAHLRTGVNVEAHVVITQLGQVLLQLLCKGHFPQRTVSAEREKAELWIVEEVNRAKAMRQEVEHSHRDQFVVQPVLLMERAERVLRLRVSRLEGGRKLFRSVNGRLDKYEQQ